MDRESLRVLYLIDCLYSDAGGGTEKQFIKLYNNNSYIGLDPYVVFLKDAPVHGSIAWRFKPLVLKQSSIFSLRTVVAVLSLLTYIRRNNIRIIHTFYDESAVLGAILKTLLNDVILLISVRNMVHHHGIFRHLFMGAVYRRADVVLTNAFAIKNLLVKDYRLASERVKVIYNLVDEEQSISNRASDAEFKSIRSKHEYVVVVVSNLRAVKGVDDVIAAAERLKDVLDVAVVIIGDGPLRNEYEDKVRSRRLYGTVYLLGSKIDIAEYLLNADLGVLASHSEGLANALIEYAMAGLPIVATRVGGNAEILSDGLCGVLVPPKSPQALADAIRDLLLDPDRRMRLGRSARNWAVGTFQKTKILDDYKRLYWGLI